MFWPTVPRRTDVIAHATDLVIWNRAVFFFIREFCWKRRSKGGGLNYSLFLVIALPTARTDEDEIRRYGTYFTYLYARDDTCYIPESRKTFSARTEYRTTTSSENPAQMCEDQTLVFPLGFANGGKPRQFPPSGASFRLRSSYSGSCY